jgi:hypothetical protein
MKPSCDGDKYCYASAFGIRADAFSAAKPYLSSIGFNRSTQSARVGADVKPKCPKAGTAVPPLRPGLRSGKSTRFGGSQFDAWNDQIIHDTANALWVKHSNPDTLDRQFLAAYIGLAGIAPKDELEGMMAAQLIASHSAAMECYRRAMLADQTFEGRREALSQANKLSRTFTVLLDALNRHRGKGQQKVTVEHVHIHAGGQAVVGAIAAQGGGDRAKLEGQPHAIAHTPEPPVWSADAAGASVPIARDAERPLPDARRKIAGPAEGKS